MTTAPLNALLAGLLWAMSFDESGRGHLVAPGEPFPDLDASVTASYGCTST